MYLREDKLRKPRCNGSEGPCPVRTRVWGATIFNVPFSAIIMNIGVFRMPIFDAHHKVLGKARGIFVLKTTGIIYRWAYPRRLNDFGGPSGVELRG